MKMPGFNAAVKPSVMFGLMGLNASFLIGIALHSFDVTSTFMCIQPVKSVKIVHYMVQKIDCL